MSIGDLLVEVRTVLRRKPLSYRRKLHNSYNAANGAQQNVTMSVQKAVESEREIRAGFQTIR